MATQVSFNECRVLSDQAEKLISFGMERLEFYQIMPERGVIEKPIFNGEWVFQVYDPDSIKLPAEAQRRLDAALRNPEVHVRQAIYGYQVKVVPETETEVEPQPNREFKLPDGTLEAIVKGVLTVAVGSALVLGAAFLYALLAIDPLIAVCLDDMDEDKDKTWVCLYSWEE